MTSNLKLKEVLDQLNRNGQHQKAAIITEKLSSLLAELPKEKLLELTVKK